MSHPDYPVPAQPAPSEGFATSEQSQPEQAQPVKKSGRKKWTSVAGTIVVVGAGAAYQLTGHFGIGDPKVGDCLHMKSETDFEQVSCDDDSADAKVIGIEDKKLTEKEFTDAAEICTNFADAEGGIWYQNGMITEKGTVYCVVPR
jgi:hypothetical protein